MAQPSIVSSFRQRAKRLGYQRIIIEKLSSGWYYVAVVEPLAGHAINFVCDLSRMAKLLRGGDGK